MNPLNVWRALGLAGKITVGVIVVIVIAVALWAVYRAVDAPRRAAEAKVEARTATAYGASSRAAMDVVAAAASRDAQTKEKINDELERIQALPAGDRYDASIGLLCGLHEYSSDPRCAELRRARAR